MKYKSVEFSRAIHGVFPAFTSKKTLDAEVEVIGGKRELAYEITREPEVVVIRNTKTGKVVEVPLSTVCHLERYPEPAPVQKGGK